jgi:hypothetical protein
MPPITAETFGGPADEEPGKEHHRNGEHGSGDNATPRQGVVHPSALSGHGDSFVP